MAKSNDDKKTIESLQDLESMKHLVDDKIIYINIEKLEVQTPNVEEFIYKLENLDIKELSGALNIGNNLGTTVNKPSKKKGQKSKEPGDKKTESSEPNNKKAEKEEGSDKNGHSSKSKTQKVKEVAGDEQIDSEKRGIRVHFNGREIKEMEKRMD